MATATSPIIGIAYTAEPAIDERIRTLIRTRYAILGRQQDWTLAHFEALRRGRYFEQDRSGDRSWMDNIHLWETIDGELVGVVHPGDGEPGDLVLAVHPDWQQIEPDMLAWAENRWREQGLTRAETDVYDWDTRRAALLKEHGWSRLWPCTTEYTRELIGELPQPVLPPGYHIRAARDDEADIQQHIAIILAVFGHTFTEELLRYTELRPTPHEYWVVEATDGTWAAWCGLWCDEQNKVAEFEPVGTQPAHRRKGLATAVMTHALHRMRSRGMRRAVVNTGYSMEANHLYEQVLGPRRAVIDRWTRELPA